MEKEKEETIWKRIISFFLWRRRISEKDNLKNFLEKESMFFCNREKYQRGKRRTILYFWGGEGKGGKYLKKGNIFNEEKEKEENIQRGKTFLRRRRKRRKLLKEGKYFFMEEDWRRKIFDLHWIGRTEKGKEKSN